MEDQEQGLKVLLIPNLTYKFRVSPTEHRDVDKVHWIVFKWPPPETDSPSADT